MPTVAEIEEMLPSASETRKAEPAHLEELLSNLEFVAEMLAEVRLPLLESTLLFRKRDKQVEAKPIGKSISFGRSDDNEISFPDMREVSRHHFKIVAQGDHYVLTDTGSSNGTFIRGNRMRIERHELRDGDIIEAAGFAFVFIR